MNFQLFGHECVFFTPEMVSSHLSTYTTQEKEWIAKDLQVVKSICFTEGPASDSPRYIATAGAPGARKTTILERYLANLPTSTQTIYIDSDQRALKFMVHTYYSRSLNALQIAENQDYTTLLQNAYEKWRPASNYIALSLLEEAFSQRRDIAFGITSTGAITAPFLQAVKQAGYQITLLLCSCEDHVRYEAIEYRNNNLKFYQSTPEDAVAKGKLFALRMPDYLALADELYFYWSDALFAKERLAAIYRDGKIQVLDADAFQRFIDKYNRDRQAWQGEGVALPVLPCAGT